MKINMKQFSMEFFKAFAQCKEYLFVKRYGKNSFEVGKIGYYISKMNLCNEQFKLFN